MPTLKISSIVCEVTEESDKDEIFLVSNGKKIWPKDKKYLKIDVDETLDVGLRVKINRPLRIKIELWDYDLTSQNDHLGDFYLEIRNLEDAQHTELLILNEKEAEKASYFLNWEVINE